jgi:hypothetical protein
MASFQRWYRDQALALPAIASFWAGTSSLSLMTSPRERGMCLFVEPEVPREDSSALLSFKVRLAVSGCDLTLRRQT